MKEKLKLSPGEELRLEKSKSIGTMGQTDVYTYSIVNNTGEIVGSVVHTDEIKLNGLKRAQSLVQKDLSGAVIIDEHWRD
ncbi:hypothetical protein EYS14_14780 [Alteromonadaceae bacterium M269]|nr:hypothetical protein EYS14_14780 [Alteromonadaceae bacterium M269]